MDNIRIGLIGCGIWGQKILDDLLSLHIEIRVADPHPPALNLALKKGARSAHLHVDKLLELNMTAWIIATPSVTHFELIQKVQHTHVPIFVEKPMVTSLKDAIQIRDTCHKDIYVMHIWKCHPGIKMLAEIASNKTLGNVKGGKSIRANWTSPRKDTDSLWNLAIHDLSISECLLGEMPAIKSVIAEKHAGIIRGLYVHMGNEPYYCFEASNRFPDKRREVRLFCEFGVAILWDEIVDYIEVYEGNDQSQLTKDSVSRIYFDRTPPLKIELIQYINYLKGGPPPISDLEEAIRLIKALDVIQNLIKP